MPIDLHQRLSEFSYGYGVTREFESKLRSAGIKATPFLPSLLHEAKLGFDVKFDVPGKPLLIQFKLGEVLKRFRNKNGKPAPKIKRPFWRFRVDTAEAQGQYDLLLKAERAGAEVFYIAPRFADWDTYAGLFQKKRVLRRSLVLRPSEIEKALRRQGEVDGIHRVVYDRSKVYVCSEPEAVGEVGFDDLAQQMRVRIEQQEEPIVDTLRRVYKSVDAAREIARDVREVGQYRLAQASSPMRSLGRLTQERERRLEYFRELSDREEDAIMAALGVEAWAVGSQLFVAALVS